MKFAVHSGDREGHSYYPEVEHKSDQSGICGCIVIYTLEEMLAQSNNTEQ